MKKTTKEEAYFVLDGKVYFQIKKGRKIVEQAEIDGEAVLKILIQALKRGLDSMESEFKSPKRGKS